MFHVPPMEEGTVASTHIVPRSATAKQTAAMHQEHSHKLVVEQVANRSSQEVCVEPTCSGQCLRVEFNCYSLMTSAIREVSQTREC